MAPRKGVFAGGISPARVRLKRADSGLIGVIRGREQQGPEFPVGAFLQLTDALSADLEPPADFIEGPFGPIIQTGAQHGMVLYEKYVDDLVKKGLVSMADAKSFLGKDSAA